MLIEFLAQPALRVQARIPMARATRGRYCKISMKGAPTSYSNGRKLSIFSNPCGHTTCQSPICSLGKTRMPRLFSCDYLGYARRSIQDIQCDGILRQGGP